MVGFALPFEAIPALVSTPWFGLTDDKLLLLVLIVGWLLQGTRSLSRDGADASGAGVAAMPEGARGVRGPAEVVAPSWASAPSLASLAGGASGQRVARPSAVVSEPGGSRRAMGISAAGTQSAGEVAETAGAVGRSGASGTDAETRADGSPRVAGAVEAAGASRAAGAGAAGWLVTLPTWAEWRWLLPSLVFIVVNLVSARLAAAEYADEAVRSVARLLAAALFMLVGLRLGRDLRQARGVLWAIVVGAGLSGVLGLGEAVRWAPLQPVLELFKVAPTRVGGELRVSASFQYATIAAMYFEMVAPLAIVLAATARRRSAQLLGVGIAVVCTANVVLSLTRAGMLTLFTIYAALAVVGCARGNLRRVLPPTLLSAAALIGGAILLFVHDPVFDLRLQTESDADWYGADYAAPATLTLQADHTSTVGLDVRNEGRIAWTSSGNHPFALGYRWLTDDGTGVLDVTPAEIPLAHDVQPGETIHLQANVAVPDLAGGHVSTGLGHAAARRAPV